MVLRQKRSFRFEEISKQNSTHPADINGHGSLLQLNVLDANLSGSNFPNLKPMSNRNLLYLLVLLLLAFPAMGQPERTASVIHDVHKIASGVLGEERTILVRVPATYRQGDTRFPVIYMLDAHPPQNAMMAGIVEQQAWGGQLPEMIIVGIQNIDRTRDMTPTKSERSANSGGADKFLDFIQKEVIPFVEKNYRTEPFRVFAGHSLGGLLAVYTAVSRPDMFNAYIAASPVLHWDKDFVINLAREKFKNSSELRKVLYIGLGDEPTYTDGFSSFRSLLKSSAPKGLVYEFQQFPSDTHGSVVLPAYYAGLRKIFAGWPSPPNGTITDLEDHYKKLSSRFGYRIPPPEAQMNLAGYQLLTSDRITEAIAVFEKNAEAYPNSANCLDSLAEAYERSGQLRKAKETYEKAYKMAETHGETQLAISAKAKFERLVGKLK